MTSNKRRSLAVRSALVLSILLSLAGLAGCDDDSPQPATVTQSASPG
uniref:Uncharacterized protein n=1 Tax=Streptomyces sp. NBC_00003 TaxID=2903608 RepID=A0AAU2V2B4_9ACTN